MKPSPARLRREGGYLLLAIMLVMAVMIIAATAAAPRVVQQMKRDREEEMIHRGTQYARAIKAFYKKNGRYPSTLDDLDKGQIKYLRQRYKDPLTKDGKWKLLNYGDIATLLNAAAPGTPAAAMGTIGGNTAQPGSVFSNSASPTGFSAGGVQPQQQSQQPGPITSGFPSNSDSGGNGESSPGGTFAGSNTGSDQGFSSSGGNSGTGSNQPGTNNQPGGSTFGFNSSGNAQTFGGGAIVGVASLSKDPTIRIYNKKKTYNEWQFIYNPMMDQTNVLLQGPYQPTTMGGGQNVGTPASQMNGQQQNQSPFGQPNSGFGQQNNNFGQQNSGGFNQPSPSPSSSPQ